MTTFECIAWPTQCTSESIATVRISLPVAGVELARDLAPLVRAGRECGKAWEILEDGEPISGALARLAASVPIKLTAEEAEEQATVLAFYWVIGGNRLNWPISVYHLDDIALAFTRYTDAPTRRVVKAPGRWELLDGENVVYAAKLEPGADVAPRMRGRQAELAERYASCRS